jgi:hypothetical protein
MGGFLSGIGQQASEGLGNQITNKMFGSGLIDASIGDTDSSLFQDLPQQDGNQPYGMGQPPQGPQMGFGMPSQPQQNNQQYYQQMRQSIDGMNEAFKQIEQMQMPGQQYSMMGGMFGNNSNRIGK